MNEAKYIEHNIRIQGKKSTKYLRLFIRSKDAIHFVHIVLFLFRVYNRIPGDIRLQQVIDVRINIRLLSRFLPISAGLAFSMMCKDSIVR